MFINYDGQQIQTIDDSSQGTRFHLRSSARSSFRRDEIISIKDILLYNFNKDEPFTKIPSNIFLLTNDSFSQKYYYLQVIIFS